MLIGLFRQNLNLKVVFICQSFLVITIDSTFHTLSCFLGHAVSLQLRHADVEHLKYRITYPTSEHIVGLNGKTLHLNTNIGKSLHLTSYIGKSLHSTN
jgi:hypothetical protein